MSRRILIVVGVISLFSVLDPDASARGRRCRSQQCLPFGDCLVECVQEQAPKDKKKPQKNYSDIIYPPAGGSADVIPGNGWFCSWGKSATSVTSGGVEYNVMVTKAFVVLNSKEYTDAGVDPKTDPPNSELAGKTSPKQSITGTDASNWSFSHLINTSLANYQPFYIRVYYTMTPKGTGGTTQYRFDRWGGSALGYKVTP